MKGNKQWNSEIAEMGKTELAAFCQRANRELENEGLPIKKDPATWLVGARFEMDDEQCVNHGIEIIDTECFVRMRMEGGLDRESACRELNSDQFLPEYQAIQRETILNNPVQRAMLHETNGKMAVQHTAIFTRHPAVNLDKSTVRVTADELYPVAME